jgi:cytosine/adenosine deaminase-related metal-dependent hydrolase
MPQWTYGNNLSDDQLARFCGLGMSFSVAAENEMSQGHGFPITGRLRELGRALSLGVDLESVVSGEMFTQARIALGMQRALDNQAERESAGSIPETTTITAHEALAWATIEGARMLCMEDRIGSITPGKQADLVLIGAGALNMQPVHDPVSAVVMQTSLANIDSVMVAGRWKKWGGRLLVDGLAGKIDRLRESGQRILQAMGLLANETVPDSQWRTILAECTRVAPHMALLFLPARGFVLANATKLDLAGLLRM